MSLMRASTSASPAWASTPLSFAVVIRPHMIGDRWPPRSDPQNSHAFLSMAIPRGLRPAALFVRHSRPSPRKRVKPSQRVSM